MAVGDRGERWYSGHLGGQGSVKRQSLGWSARVLPEHILMLGARLEELVGELEERSGV